jgi:hypothetical protein
MESVWRVPLCGLVTVMIIKVEHGRYNLFLDPDGASGGRIEIAGPYKNRRFVYNP